MSEAKKPTVFISYSQDDDSHKADVKNLTDYLRKHGIDIQLDKYHQGEELWDSWMQDRVNDSDYIFVACSESYKRKFECNDSDKSSGVCKEAIKIKDLINKDNEKALARIKILFFDEIIENLIPPRLTRCNRTNCKDQSQLNDLYQIITQQKEKAPKVGNTISKLPSESPFGQEKIVSNPQIETSLPVAKKTDKSTHSKINNLPFYIPYESKGEGAIGIEKKLEEVHTAIRTSKKTTIGQGASFQGIGGLGKTQLAVEYAHHYCDDYAGGIVWLTADQNIENQLIDLAEKSGWVNTDVDVKAKLDIATARYAGLKGALLIYDNVEKVSDIESLFPQSTNHILLTSRNAIQDFTSVPLNTLNEKNSLELLASESGREIKQEELTAAKTLANKFDGLPLALEMAGAYVAHLGLSWNDYLKLFEAKGVGFVDQAQIRGATNHESNISKTLSLNEELLEKTANMKDIVNLLAWGANEAIDKRLMSKMLNLDDIELIEPIHVALKLKIIKKEEDGYVLHRLIRDVWKSQHSLNTDFAEHVASHLADYMQSIQKEFLHIKKLERAAIQALCWKNEVNNPKIQARLLGSSAFPDAYMGRYKEGLIFVEQALPLVETLGDSPELANLYNYKEFFENSLGDAQSARPYCEQALEMRQRLYPEQDHSDVALSLNNMGTVLKPLEDAKSARPYHEQALEMYQRLYPEQDHPDVAMSLDNMGSVLDSLENAQSGRSYYEQALEMYQRLYPEQDHPDVALSLSNTGLSYWDFKFCFKAEKLLAEALAMYLRLKLEPARQQDISIVLKRIKKSIKQQKKAGARKGRFCKD